MLFEIMSLQYRGWGNVIIPFVCKKCGKCCKERGVKWKEDDIRRAADSKNMEDADFLRKYFLFQDPEGEMKYDLNPSPCPFLKDNECSIYQNRPNGCRLYPTKTDFGRGNINCPGREEMDRAVKKIGQGVPHQTSGGAINEPNSNYSSLEEYISRALGKRMIPTEDKWDKIKKKYLKSDPSNEAERLFFKINGKVRNYYLGGTN